MLLPQIELVNEIRHYKKNIFLVFLNETIITILAIISIIINFVFEIFVLLNFDDRKDYWIYFLCIFIIIDLLIFIFAIVFYKKIIKRKSLRSLPIPFFNTIINVSEGIIFFFNTISAIFGACSFLFQDSKYFVHFFAIFSIQTLFLYLLWGFIFSWIKKKANKLHLNVVKDFIDFDIQNISKYEEYVVNRIPMWAEKWNKYLVAKNSLSDEKKIAKIFFPLFGKKNWKKNMIDVGATFVKRKIINNLSQNKKIIEYKEVCKYNFLVFFYIFSELFKDSKNLLSEFKLFFFVHDSDITKQFYKKLNIYLKQHKTSLVSKLFNAFSSNEQKT